MKNVTTTLLMLLLSCTAFADVLLGPRYKTNSPGEAEYTITILPKMTLKGKVLVFFQDGFDVPELSGWAIPVKKPIKVRIGSWGRDESDSLRLQAGYLLVLDSAEYNVMFKGKKSVTIPLTELQQRNAIRVRNLFTQELLDFFENTYYHPFEEVKETFALLQDAAGKYYLASTDLTYSTGGNIIKHFSRDLSVKKSGVQQKKGVQESTFAPPPALLPALLIALGCGSAAAGLAIARQRTRHQGKKRLHQLF